MDFFCGLILGYITILFKQPILTLIIWGISMSVLVIEGIIGWRKSVRKWLKVCIWYNLLFSLFLTAIVQEKIKYSISAGLFTTIYMIIWLFLSLISYSKISILVNEVISGISATVFTIGTYLVSLRLGSLPSVEEFHDYFNTTSKYEMESESITRTLLKYVEVEILDEHLCFVSFLLRLKCIGWKRTKERNQKIFLLKREQTSKQFIYFELKMILKRDFQEKSVLLDFYKSILTNEVCNDGTLMEKLWWHVCDNKKYHIKNLFSYRSSYEKTFRNIKAYHL